MQVVQVKDLNSSIQLNSTVEKVIVVPANQYGASSRGAGIELGLSGARPSLPNSTFSLSGSFFNYQLMVIIMIIIIILVIIII